MRALLNLLEKEIKTREISPGQISDILQSNKDLINRRIISGYASVDMIDREGQRIPITALQSAVDNFMKNIFARPVSVFHSDVQVGRILPKWTDPNSGKTYENHVDETGWLVIVEVRDDTEIANKTWDEIIKGNLRSFSIAGSSKEKLQKQENGVRYEEVKDLEIYECAICFPEWTKVWTSTGLKNIKDIDIGEEVLTHKTTKIKPSWKKVMATMSREVNEELVKITTERGILTPTYNHPIRVLNYGRQNIGTGYTWKNADGIKVGDFISDHISNGNCEVCNKPLFGYQNKFCSKECKAKQPNRKGKTIASGDIGAIKQSEKLRGTTKEANPNLTGGIKTEEGRLKNKLAHQTPEFCLKRKNIQTELWKNAEYATNQCLLQRRRPNKTELYVQELLDKHFPGEWKYVGDGKFWIEGKNPDFININGQKKVIEFNGIYWHKNDDPTSRIEHFKKYGYETLILDDNDIKKNNFNLEKIDEFCGNTLTRVINIEKMPFEGIVYNLEVEEDNSYVTEFGVAHNCEIPVNQMSKFSVLWNPNQITI